jgi:hypothetical protein
VTNDSTAPYGDVRPEKNKKAKLLVLIVEVGDRKNIYRKLNVHSRSELASRLGHF